MKRIFPAYTYSEAPRARCYWPTTADLPDVETASGTLHADIAIIGAGYTGLNAALRLAEAGEDVIVLETHAPGWGASGRNGGFCGLGGSKASDPMLKLMFGEAARKEYRLAEWEAVKHVTRTLEKYTIGVDAHSHGETVVAHTPKAFKGFAAEAKQTEADLGVTPTIITAQDMPKHGLGTHFHGAMTTPIGFAINPLKYVRGLVDAATKAGVRLFGHSPVQRIDHGQGFTLTTDAAQISAKRLVVATNGYSSDDLPDWLRNRYLPTQSNILVTRPLSDDEIATQGWTSHQMCHDYRTLLHYFRLMPNKQMLFGMRGGMFSSSGADARMYKTIRRHFDTMFPAWAHVETPYSWNGLISMAQDLTPYAGPIPELPGAYTALCYHGNGVAMGSYAGALLADQMQGKTGDLLHPKVMHSPHKKFPLGRLRRATLWPVYAYAGMTGN
ncbi:Gamma-glutamylputrescine oxidoreductase [Roseovarius albus]|uniref:Gamma-glutamylputrescine oxidoreductase n=1 Tax=Roseovarius albus TaxID=1247867 RepID=A0A1X6YPZ7_9RHOB|nr:FAD-binding oxidoreductase [Roseovarius albus]SLN27758.1 Gamma-glutamylputrescine oxidoreductase [Roseovarius albus]